MYLYKTSLLKKIGISGAKHWRQLTISITQDTERYVLSMYYGRSLKNLQKLQEFTFDTLWLAENNLNYTKKQRIRDEYEEIELLTVPSTGLPFSDFIPPQFYLPNKLMLENLLASKTKYIAIPIYQGERIYIKMGCESITSIKVMDTQNNRYDLDVKHIKKLQNIIQLGNIESIILEAYINENNLTIIDIACINGIKLTCNYVQRIEKAKALFNNEDPLIKITKFITPTSTILRPPTHLHENAPRYFITKQKNAEFPYESNINSPFIIPHFYEFNAIVLTELNKKTKRYDIAMMNEKHRLVKVGEIESKKDLTPSDKVIINCEGLAEGQLSNPWYSPKNFQQRCKDIGFTQQLFCIDDKWAI